MSPSVLALRRVAVPYVATRLFVLAVSWAALAWWGLDPREATGNFGGTTVVTGPLDVFVRYDAAWYLTIARVGFTAPIDAGYDMRPGWFPLFPALIALVSTAVPNGVMAGLVVSNAALLALLALFWTLVREDLGEGAATRAVWALLLFPSSFYLSGVYSESTMLAAIAASWLAARRRRWWLSGVALAAAAVTRPVGVLAAIPVLAEVWRGREGLRATVWRLVQVTGPATVSVIAWLALAAWWFGDPFTFVEHQGWYRGTMGWPWQGFVRWWTEGPAWHGYANSSMDAAIAAGALGLSVVVWRRWRWDYGLYCLAAVLVPISSSLVSFSRLVLAALPLAVALALVARRRGPRLVMALASLSLLALLAARFATWRWVA